MAEGVCGAAKRQTDADLGESSNGKREESTAEKDANQVVINIKSAELAEADESTRLLPPAVAGQAENKAEKVPESGVSVANDERQEQQKIQEPKDFLIRFNTIFDGTTSTEQKKADFKTLLNADDVNLKKPYVKQAFVKMLNDIAKYEEFLELFIERFTAYNERIEAKTKKQRRPITNEDQKTMRDLDTPLHCAVRQLNVGFIEWLLKQPATEVNLRNKQKETALAILCQKYGCLSKLKTRLKYIEKELKKVDAAQKRKLDCEKIEMSAQMNELEEEMTKNAPTILTILLKKGADFNIYMNDWALPFDFLRKYRLEQPAETDLDNIINFDNISNVAMTGKPPKQLNNSAKGKNKSKTRIVKIYKKTENPKVRVTVELLEIFICFDNLKQFKHYWKNFQVTSHNVKKVITLLLHAAVERNYTTYVDHIIKKASTEIFKPEENKATNTQDPTQDNISMNPEGSCLVKAEENQMVHHNELKGLLKMVCLYGNIALLNIFLKKMNDRLLVNEHPLLIITLNRAYTMKQKKESIFLMECTKILINNHKQVDMYRVDKNGNTALHLALSYGYDSIALLMLNKVHSLMWFSNRQNKMSIEYGTTEFWNTYLDSCISTNNDESELRFNVDFLKPRTKYESSDSFTRTVNDMTALRLISQSKDRKELLMHPVITAFITMKWKRYFHWVILNLLLTTVTMGLFMYYTIMSCPTVGQDDYKGYAEWGFFMIIARGFLHGFILGWSYTTLQYAVDFLTMVSIFVIVVCKCSRDYICSAVPFLLPVVVVTLSLQTTFFLGATRNNLSPKFVMFKTVSINFILNALYFIPVFVAFVCSFYRIYRYKPSGFSISNGTQSNSFEQNFNNSHSAWDAAIKAVVMPTGEFDINYDGVRGLLFVGFTFIVPIVIVNLIHDLARGVVPDILKQSEFISLCERVRLLERYDYNKGLLLEKCSIPCRPFFENYENFIYVMLNKKNNLAINPKRKKNAKKAIPGWPWFSSNRYISLDQSNVEKANAIVRRQSKNSLGLDTSELAEPVVTVLRKRMRLRF